MAASLNFIGMLNTVGTLKIFEILYRPAVQKPPEFILGVNEQNSWLFFYRH